MSLPDLPETIADDPAVHVTEPVEMATEAHEEAEESPEAEVQTTPPPRKTDKPAPSAPSSAIPEDAPLRPGVRAVRVNITLSDPAGKILHTVARVCPVEKDGIVNVALTGFRRA